MYHWQSSVYSMHVASLETNNKMCDWFEIGILGFWDCYSGFWIVTLGLSCWFSLLYLIQRCWHHSLVRKLTYNRLMCTNTEEVKVLWFYNAAHGDVILRNSRLSWKIFFLVIEWLSLVSTFRHNVVKENLHAGQVLKSVMPGWALYIFFSSPCFCVKELKVEIQ